MATKKSRSSIRTRVEGALKLLGQDYPFVIYHQQESLGSAGPLDYWYMLPTPLRALGDLESIQNYRSCVAFWWAGALQAGLGDDWEQVRHLVVATTYPLFCRQRAVQNVFHDAFLKPAAINPDEIAVPADDLARIKEVVASRDWSRVKKELDTLSDAHRPTPDDLVGFGEAFIRWVDKGVNAYRLNGLDKGLGEWLDELEGWVVTYRKNSKTSARVRAFVNHFGYLAKETFYLCYANFWASLIPWLREHHGLNDLSARFLKVWHNQNQPVRLPSGTTASGLVYPTHGRAQLLAPAPDSGMFAPPEITWKTPPPAPEIQPDVFSGQVLSLHPLAWFFLSDPAACHLAGKFFSRPDFDEIMTGNNTEKCDDYWGFVQAILVAGHTYRQAHHHFELGRGALTVGGESTRAVTGDKAPLREKTALQDYVNSKAIRCCCGGEPSYCGYERVPDDEQVVQLQLECNACGNKFAVDMNADELSGFLNQGD